MRAQIQKHWYAIRTSYWFVPSLMVLGAVALSIVTFAIDVAIGDHWPKMVTGFGLNTPAGARAVLSTIAGSMITVAGVSFSILIAAVVFATGQLGPRLLAIFMADTSNKVTLGTFIATFLYGLLVLRTVHGGEDGERFVPHLGVLVALLLALASLAVLISFIHHVPRSISAAQVVARIGADLIERSAQLFPQRLGEAVAEGSSLANVATDLPSDAGIAIRAAGDGYITHVDLVSLADEIGKRDGVLQLRQPPGAFVSQGEVLATAHGIDADASLHDAVRTAIVLDTERTNQQDYLFVVQQMVEIAIRALSPGINDPFTAIGCLDWLGSGAIQLGHREMPSKYRRDTDGKLRLVVPSFDFADVTSAMFDRLRPYAASDRNACLHTFATLTRVMREVAHPPYRAALLEQAAALNDAAQQCLALERDRIAATAAYAALRDAA
ncbi:MAG: DUF2254 domain-containing protein [Alphaproteobacteria bacterium]